MTGHLSVSKADELLAAISDNVRRYHQAGIIGSKERSSYALVGDTVNLASRIQGLTKKFSCDVILSQTTHDLVTCRFQMEQLPAVKVKGKSRDVMVYKLMGRD